MNNIPKSWSEVFVYQFIELLTFDKEQEEYTNKHINILSILMDILPDDEYWEDLDTEELNILIGNIKWIFRLPNNNYKKDIDSFKCIDINTLTFGQYIDINSILDNQEPSLVITKLASILYRKYKVDEFNNISYEKYGSYNLDNRSLEFDEFKITDIYGILKLYLDFREQLNRTFEYLFEPVIDEEDLDEQDIEEELIDEEDIKREKSEKLNNKWGWESILWKLSNGDITKYDQITDMSVIFIFNQLSFMKDMELL